MTYKERWRHYNEFLKNMGLTPLQERHLDILNNAVSIEECRFVMMNTDLRTMQDYALCKEGFFASKTEGKES